MCVLWRSVSFRLKGRAQRLFSGNGSAQSRVAPPAPRQLVPSTSPGPHEEDASNQRHSPRSHLGRAQQVAAPGTGHSCPLAARTARSPPGPMQSWVDLVQALVNTCRQVRGPRPLPLLPPDPAYFRSSQRTPQRVNSASERPPDPLTALQPIPVLLPKTLSPGCTPRRLVHLCSLGGPSHAHSCIPKTGQLSFSPARSPRLCSERGAPGWLSL